MFYPTVIALSRGLLVGALAGFSFACSPGGLKGSGTVKTDTRAVTGFTQIVLGTMGEVTVTQTGTESLTIDAEDNLLPHLSSTVSAGRLTLDADTALRPSKPIHYAITVKDLTRVEVSGAGKLSGAQLHASAIQALVSGAGDIVLAGRADSEDVRISGAGQYDGSELETKTATVVVDGAGSAVVHAVTAVDAKVSGVGSVEYIGDPKVTQSVTGVGSIKKR